MKTDTGSTGLQRVNNNFVHIPHPNACNKYKVVAACECSKLSGDRDRHVSDERYNIEVIRMMVIRHLFSTILTSFY